MPTIIPCDDCGTPIDIGHLGKRYGNDRFVCTKCKKKYNEMERLVKSLERAGTASREVH
jgi:transposase-like protein